MSVPNDPTQGLPIQGPHDDANPGAAALSPTALPGQPGEDHSRNQTVPTAPDGQTAPPFQPGQAAPAKNASDALPAQSENVRWVEVNNVGGWPAMSKTLRDYDEEKVKDCKEDVDTLLVFAGLYSAVLSAFTIESYQNLQPDTKDEIVFVLRHMAAQSYTFNAGFLNATTPVPDLPPFEPPLWAVRVNVLWFASLVFSLAAASLGMLVKQWLREFLAMDYTSPQQRLRARQFREPALKAWKVYEIAAVLPLLLQIALGLFFVGLCYFTAQIHSSVAHTTLPLVCGWVFFFLTTTVAPLVSPRCPFKTTLLKNVMKSARRHGFVFVRECLKVFIILDHLVGSIFRRDYLSLLLPSHTTISTSTSRVLRLLVKSTSWMKRLRIKLEANREQRLDSLLTREEEEEEVVMKETDDTNMLLAADSVMPGNTFLPTILGAYKSQNLKDPDGMNHFILQLISTRTFTPNSIDLEARSIKSSLDLRPLSEQDWTALLEALVEVPLDPADSQRPTDLQKKWRENVFMILFSESKHGLRPVDVEWLRRWLPFGMLPQVLPKMSNDSAKKTMLLVQMVQYLSGHAKPTGILTASMDLRGLTRPEWESIAAAATDIIQHHPVEEIDDRSAPWTRYILHLLLSHSQFHLPTATKKLLAALPFHVDYFLTGMASAVDLSKPTNDTPPPIHQIRRLLTYCMLDQNITETLDSPMDLSSIRGSTWNALVTVVFATLEHASCSAALDGPTSSQWVKQAIQLLLSETRQARVPPPVLGRIKFHASLGLLILRHGARYLTNSTPADATRSRVQLIKASAEALYCTPFEAIPDLSNFDEVNWLSLMDYTAQRLSSSTTPGPIIPDLACNYVDILLSRSEHNVPSRVAEELKKTVMHSPQSMAYILRRCFLRSEGRSDEEFLWIANRLFEAEVPSVDCQSRPASLSEYNATRDNLIAVWFPRFQEFVTNPPALVYFLLALLTHLYSHKRDQANVPAAGPEAKALKVGTFICEQIPFLFSEEQWKRIRDMLVHMLDRSLGSHYIPGAIPSWLVYTIMVLLSSTPRNHLHHEVIRVVIRSWKLSGFCRIMRAHIPLQALPQLNSRFLQICGNTDGLEGCLQLYSSALCSNENHDHGSLTDLLEEHFQQFDENGTAEHLLQFLLKCSERNEHSWQDRRSWLISRQVLHGIATLSERFKSQHNAIDVFTEVFRSTRNGHTILLQLSSREPVPINAELYIAAFVRSYKDDHPMLLAQLHDHLSVFEGYKEESILDPIRLCAIYIHIIHRLVNGCADCPHHALIHDGLSEDHQWSSIWVRLNSLILKNTELDVDRRTVLDILTRLRSLQGRFLDDFPVEVEATLSQLQ